MQKIRNNHNFVLKYFYDITALFTRQLSTSLTIVSVFLFSLSAQAQVAPAPAAGTGAGSGASGTSGAGGVRSGASPGATQGAPAGQGVALPPGVNINNLPANIQQQIRQQAGQGNGRGANGATTPADQSTSQNERNIDSTGTGVETNQKNTAVESGYEAARRQEQEEQRRKIFGYSLFNDPAIQATFQPNVNMATPRNYIVGPGDQLNIRLYGFSEFDFSQKVSPEGAVYFANQTGIGPIYVTGLTVEQAKARMVSRLATKFVGLRNSSYGPANTFLEVSLGTIRSIRVTVTGDAVRPGTYTMSSLSTVMNAIYQAGGPNELGSFRRVQLIRNNKVVATLDLYDYLLNGTQRNDFRLQDNDNIRFTTYLEHVEITGTVKRNNIFEMIPGETFDRLLFYAGDFAANAYKGRVKVRRLTDRELKVVDVTTSEFKTFVMQDGDLVTVEQLLDRFENQVTIEGAVYRPGQYSLDQNKSLKQLINSAEGLKGDAFQGRVNIIRTREDLAIENITVNLGDILAGTAPDLQLQREDQIIITSRFDLAEQAAISVQGEVNLPIEGVPYMANMTLEDALLRAGGLKESAAASLVEVVRRKKDADPRSSSAQIAETFRFNVNRDLSIGADQNRFVLEPFDQVIVRRSPNYRVQTYANVEGEVIIPGAYPIRSKDQKISDLVTLAGGLTPQAYVEGATLIRRVQLSADELARRQKSVEDLAEATTTGKAVVETETLSPDQPESIGINLKKILTQPGSSEDILVQEGDILRIPKLLETVRVQGEVLLPTTVKFRTGQTFQDYISQSGGFTSKSQRRKSFIVYANGSVDRTRKFIFFNIYPRVEPGSEVIIPKKTSVPLTPQQILSSTAGTISSLLSVIGLVIALSNVAR
ncbi:SLBB domain-containing protein [Spirosoma sp. RP8]|uniref:SLBB domain-containing protein n=1 Tax=Spirosoma liriopis TaxID=2937440 RepID=A0ABT0HFJ1_9BACT|nr:SLBB domain-containing protein [Spirosoma liriopis]MCK8490921.1 SLBB domain-containing protein [Spirosoma liriopis]